MPDLPTPTKTPRCRACNGRGYLRCDCWPGDCLCGWDDMPCEECDGTGHVLPDDYHGYEWMGQDA